MKGYKRIRRVIRVICTDCYGTGLFIVSECSTCKGTGDVERVIVELVPAEDTVGA